MMQQSVSQLSYRLLAEQTDLRPLRILASHELTWGEWEVRIHVLGASHAIEFRRGDECVTELLACVSPAGAQTPLIALQADVPGKGCASVPGLVCRVRIAPFSLTDGDRLGGYFALENRLDVRFPSTGGEGRRTLSLSAGQQDRDPPGASSHPVSSMSEGGEDPPALSDGIREPALRQIDNSVTPGGATPVTRVGWRRSGPSLRFETVHSYPEEGIGVRSLSVFGQEETER